MHFIIILLLLKSLSGKSSVKKHAFGFGIHWSFFEDHSLMIFEKGQRELIVGMHSLFEQN